ncbi:MAG: hypothetical protein CMH57_15475 [Myxococcales bacterium]|nr:hypothetical protein [Myxococcales bacterium]
MDTDELRARVEAHPYWYHRIELPGGVVTPGWAPLQPDAYGVPERLDGLRVLDVGAWDGFWSFEALRRGAREVVAIDDFSDHLGFLDEGARAAGWESFDLCREALGLDASSCARHHMSVYEISEERLGRFDVVFLFGVLYHLRYPLLGLDRVSAVCDRALYVESAILDDFSAYQGGLGRGYRGGHVVAEFYPQAQYGNNPSNWWVPTLSCLGALMRAAGFAQVQGWALTEQPTSLQQCRGFAVGRKDG